MERFEGHGISFRYPSNWHIAGFSTTVFPARVAVASYPLPADAVEGDCGGIVAVRRLPADGALVLLIDYGDAGVRGFGPRPRHFALRGGKLADYECFGHSYLFQFRIGGRDLQAHLLLGRNASEMTAAQALEILDSLSETQDG
ncbi:MAG: hypothetical protein ABI649_02460 [Gaiellaceae bacterium]